jgi:hypothetical protein
MSPDLCDGAPLQPVDRSLDSRRKWSYIGITPSPKILQPFGCVNLPVFSNLAVPLSSAADRCPQCQAIDLGLLAWLDAASGPLFHAIPPRAVEHFWRLHIRFGRVNLRPCSNNPAPAGARSALPTELDPLDEGREMPRSSSNLAWRKLPAIADDTGQLVALAALPMFRSRLSAAARVGSSR